MISNIASEKLSILSEIAVIISFTVETKPLAILPQSRLAKSFIILVIIVLSVLGNFGNVSTTNVNILSSISSKLSNIESVSISIKFLNVEIALDIALPIVLITDITVLATFLTFSLINDICFLILFKFSLVSSSTSS